MNQLVFLSKSHIIFCCC